MAQPDDDGPARPEPDPRPGPGSDPRPGPHGVDGGAVGHPGVPAAPPELRHLSDRGAVVLAVAAALGAWWAAPVPVAVGAGLAVLAFTLRRPSVLVLGVAALAATFGHRAEAGLRPPEPAAFEGVVTLVSDPRDTPWGGRADVRLGGRRYELSASGGAAGTLSRALAGERLRVQGRLRPPPPDSPWLKPRHVVGRLTVDRAEAHDAGAAPWRAANRLRRLLQRGAQVMQEPARSLYGGFVLGDDRGQGVEVVDDFRAAGLTHLLVVSGSNVAYLLVLAAPITGRLPLAGRWAATLAVVAAFAVVTRFEPSILRASAMAALSVSATLAGRPAGSLRIVGLAVTALVLVDPLLVHSIAFQLSVAASVGIVVLARPISAALPGPRWLGDALGVTLAAQLAVAPVLVPRFGGMPVVAIPANVVAVPAAGLVTTWGLPAGVAAGILGPGAARWLHLPTSAAIDWVAGTARVAASLPLGELRTGGLLALVTAGSVAAVGRARGWPGTLRIGALGVAGAVLLAPAVALRWPPRQIEAAPGVAVHRSGGATVVVLAGGTRPAAALEALRRSGVRRIDVLVAEPDPALTRALRHRWPLRRQVDPTVPVDLVVGDLRVRTGTADAGAPPVDGAAGSAAGDGSRQPVSVERLRPGAAGEPSVGAPVSSGS